MKNHSLAIQTGVVLLAVFVLQRMLDLEWPWLLRLQEDRGYKLVSGLILFALVGAQWAIAALRAAGRPRTAKRGFHLHLWLGALTPAAVYFHSTRLGYGTTLLLSLVFLLDVMLGLFHQTLRRWLRRRLLPAWITLHVAVSVLVVVLMAHHMLLRLLYE